MSKTARTCILVAWVVVLCGSTGCRRKPKVDPGVAARTQLETLAQNALAALAKDDFATAGRLALERQDRLLSLTDGHGSISGPVQGQTLAQWNAGYDAEFRREVGRHTDGLAAQVAALKMTERQARDFLSMHGSPQDVAFLETAMRTGARQQAAQNAQASVLLTCVRADGPPADLLVGTGRGAADLSGPLCDALATALTARTGGRPLVRQVPDRAAAAAHLELRVSEEVSSWAFKGSAPFYSAQTLNVEVAGRGIAWTAGKRVTAHRDTRVYRKLELVPTATLEKDRAALHAELMADVVNQLAALGNL